MGAECLQKGGEPPSLERNSLNKHLHRKGRDRDALKQEMNSQGPL